MLSITPSQDYFRTDFDGFLKQKEETYIRQKKAYEAQLMKRAHIQVCRYPLYRIFNMSQRVIVNTE